VSTVPDQPEILMRYVLPRNPDIPRIGPARFFASQLDENFKNQPRRHRASTGERAPNRQAWDSTRGLLQVYNAGLLFLQRDVDLEELQAILKFGTGMAAGALASAAFAAGDYGAAADVVQAAMELFKGDEAQGQRFVNWFHKALEQPATFYIPYVNVVEIASCRLARSGLFKLGGNWDYHLITSETPDGLRATYALDPIAVDFPGYAMWRRVLAEWAHLTSAVEAETGLAEPKSLVAALQRLGPRMAAYREIPAVVSGFDTLTKSMGEPVSSAWSALKK
jgi:hypothetical protein